MRTHFHIDTKLSAVNSLQYGFRVAVWAFTIFAGFGMALFDNWTLRISGVVILGLGIAHGVELCHQALHNTGFKSRRLNEFVGVLMGLPLLVSFYEYRISHLQHHAKVGTAEDTEYFDYGDGKLGLGTVLGVLTMWKHYVKYFRNLALILASKKIPGFRDKHQAKLKLFYVYSLIVVVALIGAGALIGSLMTPLYIWLAAMLFVATPTHALIEFPEHYKCNSHSQDTLQNTRSMISNPIAAYFTNYNNYHVEHHMYPNVPMQNAPKVHRVLHPRHRFHNKGYRSFYYDLIAGRL